VSTFEERRARRAGWPVRRIALKDEGAVDWRDETSVDERIALVATLTQELWSFMGTPLPTYDRAEMPGRVIRR
jgi:hypothetical protein